MYTTNIFAARLSGVLLRTACLSINVLFNRIASAVHTSAVVIKGRSLSLCPERKHCLRGTTS